MKYRPDIDGLRAVAVILVVLFHAFPGLAPGGFIGVDIFFVISGYLISGVIVSALKEGSFSFGHFYARRVLRIFPALAIVLAACLAQGWMALWPDEFKALGKHVLGGATFISNILLYNEAGYFDAASHAKPLLNLWSLGIEEQFYIAFPFMVWLAWRCWRHLFTVFLVLGLLSFWDNIFLHINHPQADFYLPLSRFWELLAGAALMAATVFYPDQNPLRRHELLKNFSAMRLAAALAGTALLALAILACENDTGNYPGYMALLPVCGAALLIGAGPENAVNRLVLANRASVFLGKISYTLYLWHWPLLSFAYILLGRHDYEEAVGLRCSLLALALILATITWLWVERPIRYGTFPLKYKIPALICSMACIGFCGWFIYATDGFPDRIDEFDSRVQQLVRRPELFDEAALRTFSPRSVGLQFCRFTDVNSGETVAVVGDSHAHAAYSGMAALGREYGFNTVLLGRYPDWVFEKPNDISWTGNNIINILSRRNDIKKVFFFFRGASMLYDRPNAGDRMKKLLPAPVAPAQLEAHLTAFIKKIVSLGKKVIIVEDNPDLEIDVRDAIFRSVTGLKIKNNYPRTLKYDVLERQGQWLEMMDRLAKIPGVEVLRGTLNAFCPAGECMVFDEAGLPLYYDDEHLSDVGSHKLAREIIRPFLEKDKNTP